MEVGHRDNMASPSELVSDPCGGDTVYISLFQHTDVSASVFIVDSHALTEALLVVDFEGSEVSTSRWSMSQLLLVGWGKMVL